MTRRSKREIESRIEDLEAARQEFPVASFADITMATTMGELEEVDEPGVIRLHGELHAISQEAFDVIREDHEQRPEFYEEESA